ncbi:sporulation protein YjcZ [Bacillus atrophaeus]|uniref:YjcZ family sporulation protein n=1 Tax=Bacillus atrophaeus TaxID=1452 RepID=UPI000D059AD9|nr:YjcZ family sporulation protein [Bacillus atrophaeus]PSA91948.1 sporulation protein YjcZ [Bacillus atrophaeus]
MYGYGYGGGCCSYGGYGYGGYGYGGGGCGGGYGRTFALIVVLFILLIIVGAAYLGC